MVYDYSKLRGRIVEVHKTLKTFSDLMGWSERTNGLKLSGAVEWKQSEIVRACALLDIGIEEMQEYFFKLNVQRNCTNEHSLYTHN